LSAAGGWWRAVEAASATGCDVVQLFLRPPGRWARPAPTADDIARFGATSEETGLVARCFAHAPYLLNLASADPVLWRHSVAVLGEELQWAAALGLAGVVLHPGSCGTGPRAEAQARCRDGIAAALALAPREGPPLLLEGAAGAGGQLGRTPAELAMLRPSGAEGRVGICLDTAHLWAAGYDLVGSGWVRVLGELAESWERRAPDLLHGNDSAAELGSLHDRHAPPGEGALGPEFFRTLLHEPTLQGTPLIVETPPGPQEKNVVKVLRRLRRWAR
jgi:deoxyribonuclease-4